MTHRGKKYIVKEYLFPSKNTVPEDGTRNILTREELTYEECEQFLPLRDGDVVYCPSVYDGDSARLTWNDSSGNKVRSLLRLKGVDTPELRTSSEKEKALALRATERLESVVVGKFVTIRGPETEKYGRVLADLETDSVKSAMYYMLEDSEICVPYDGGKKKSWK